MTSLYIPDPERLPTYLYWDLVRIWAQPSRPFIKLLHTANEIIRFLVVMMAIIFFLVADIVVHQTIMPLANWCYSVFTNFFSWINLC